MGSILVLFEEICAAAAADAVGKLRVGLFSPKDNVIFGREGERERTKQHRHYARTCVRVILATA